MQPNEQPQNPTSPQQNSQPYSPPQVGLPQQPAAMPTSPVQSTSTASPNTQQFQAPPQPAQNVQPATFFQPQRVTPSSPMQSFQQMPQQPSSFVSQSQFSEPKKSKGGLIARAALVILVLLGLAVGSFFVLNQPKKKVGVNTNSSANKSVSNAKATGDITTLKSFTLAQPDSSKLVGMRVLNPGQANDSSQYYTTISTTDAICSIAFGVDPQSDLPGTDIGSILSAKISAIENVDTNIKVTGPNNAAAIVLSASDGKTYALPTVNYAYTDPSSGGGGTIVENFSAVQLADSSHAVVYSTCSDGTANDQTKLSSRLAAIQPVVNSIKIKL